MNELKKNTNYSTKSRKDSGNSRKKKPEGSVKESVGGLILAAGLSTRMGQSKPLTKFLNKNLIDQTVKTMYDANINNIQVVTGFEHERVEAYLQKSYSSEDIQTIWNPDYGNGSILVSIKRGLPELADCEHVFIQLVDLPCIMPETYRKLLEAMLAYGKKAVIPTVEGRRGHPTLIHMELLPDILAYETGDGGGLRGFWRQLGDAVMELPVEDRGCIMDTDTKEQLREAEHYMRRWKK